LPGEEVHKSLSFDMMKSTFTALIGGFVSLSSYVKGNENLIVTPQSDLQALLPPSPLFNDSASAAFIAASGDPFITPAEASAFSETATYDEVTDFFTRLSSQSEFVRVQSLSELANGENLWMVTVSGEQKFSATEMANPVMYVTAGIHPGESSGVNAGMMFVRNLVMDPAYDDLLKSINFLFIPILNVQGYLRQSENGRINQFGPNTSGRRTNSHWHNLNRDFAKLDTQEVRAVVKVMAEYDVSFYTDLHCTDGMNYQPDVTWCDNGDAGLSNAIFSWLRSELKPDLENFLVQYNQKPGPCFLANDEMDPTAGYYPYLSDGADYSTNYADHRQIPSYLLETHSLKPNKQRVLGAYAFLYGIMTILSQKTESLRAAIETDRAARGGKQKMLHMTNADLSPARICCLLLSTSLFSPCHSDPVPIAWDYDDPPPIVDWDIFEYEVVTNPTLGIPQIIWSDNATTIQVEESTRSTPLDPPKRPYAYYIPAVWKHVIEVLMLHGIELEYLEEDVTIDVVNYRVEDFSITNPNREGRATASGTPVPEEFTRTYVPNDVVVRTDQPLGTLAVALLEPRGESSLFAWGFFNSKFFSHEYPENYIMVPLAEKLLAENTEVSADWEAYKLENTNYTENPADVLDFFFRKTAFYDSEAYVYPVGIAYSSQEDSTAPTESPTLTSVNSSSSGSAFCRGHELTALSLLCLYFSW
jgi:hypothetical protein